MQPNILDQCSDCSDIPTIGRLKNSRQKECSKRALLLTAITAGCAPLHCSHDALEHLEARDLQHLGLDPAAMRGP